MKRFTVITIFPQLFESTFGFGILKKAQEKNLIQIQLVNLRDYTSDRHRTTDDTPYGGGQGMVMKPEPLITAIEAARAKSPAARVLLMTPRGHLFKQKDAQRLAQEQELVLICGRYEGIDERVTAFVDEEISIGDYTLSGGEPAATVIIDAVARLIPGVLGNETSALEESFVDGLLEYPQYTRPEEFHGMKVPDVLLSGDHARIKRWRRERSLELTANRRPDLLGGPPTSLAEEKKVEARAPVYLALLHYPVYDKNRQVVTTAVTNMDIHDIARSGRTYGIRGFYVVTPVKALQKLALKIIDHWETGYGSQYNTTRKEALALARVCGNLDDAILGIERECGEKPALVVTSARPNGPRTSFAALRDMLESNACPVLIILGTGWGLTESIFSQADYVLEAIEGAGDYNHLSVRSAAAIILDRLLRHRR
ncbi:MAG TPA: tRNA (guanosine(37)-N1)-methyltransferase TrmD [Terriglobales bacterium]|jgi:tRNA (guanine37-N1)-methyltransferase|nr:tRNA (guanosine(37)-N1)-methyltransferase TrmD [Terriglobales bacterium]